jgi:xyloglucan-specific endo-beta-1,4-glucanase
MDRICGNGESLARGRFLILNNLWGAEGGSGSQCLWSPGAPGGPADDPISWGTGWDWTGPAETVKSYAAAILGWHWGWPGPESDLPIRLAGIGEARSRWDFRLDKTTRGPQNVAYDIWLASAEDPRMEDLTDEIMIWLHRDEGATPIGSRQATVAIGGVTWELWQGPHPGRGWTVHSFVRSANADSVSLDLARFFDYLISGGLSDSLYLVGIEAGTEVFSGAGELETTRYDVEIRRAESRRA